MENVDEIRVTLDGWKRRLINAQIGHYIAAERKSQQHVFIGTPLVIISAIVSSLLVFEERYVAIKVGAVVLSLVTTVLASIQTFLNPSEKSELHRAKAAKYGTLRRQIECLPLSRLPSTDMALALKEIRQQWDLIADDAPVTPRTVRDEIKEIFAQEEKMHQDRVIKLESSDRLISS